MDDSVGTLKPSCTAVGVVTDSTVRIAIHSIRYTCTIITQYMFQRKSQGINETV